MPRVIDAWENLAAVHVLQTGERLSSRALHAALGNAVARSHGIALRVLERIEPPRDVRNVCKGLRVRNDRRRALANRAVATTASDADSVL